jgi:hypothetical protein
VVGRIQARRGDRHADRAAQITGEDAAEPFNAKRAGAWAINLIRLRPSFRHRVSVCVSDYS